MKNKIIAIVTACLILLNCIPVFANTFEGDNTVSEIKEAEESVVEFVNNVAQTQDFKQCDSGDINYDEIYKVYTGMRGLFKNSEMNNKAIQDILQNQNYSYYVPIYDNNKTALATVLKREKLDEDVRAILAEEEIKEYEAIIGKWSASSVGIINEIRDYKGDVEKALSDNNIENANVYFLGAICSNIRLVAVICTDNPDDTKIKILEQFESKTSDDGGSKLDENTLYSYAEIKTIVDADTEARQEIPEDSVGGAGVPLQTSADTSAPAADNSKIIMIAAISGAAVLAVAIAAFCIVKKKKAAKADIEK